MARRRKPLTAEQAREYEERAKAAIEANFVELEATWRRTVAEWDAGFEARHIARQERERFYAECAKVEREWRKQERREARQLVKDEAREIGAQNLACLIECLTDYAPQHERTIFNDQGNA